MIDLAAILAGIGAAAALLARSPRELNLGLALTLAGAAWLAASTLSGDALPRISPVLIVLLAVGLTGLAVATWALVRWPVAILPALLFAAPLRLPIAADPSSPLLFEFVQGGGVGRLYPLYAMLAPALCATLWRANRRTVPFAALPRPITWPAAGLLALATFSIIWTFEPVATADLLIFFWLPFVLLFTVAARTPLDGRSEQALATILIATATVVAVLGVWQAISQDLLFYTEQLAVVNERGPLFRVTGIFQDPSHFGRYLTIAIVLVFVVLWLDRLRLAWGAVLIALLGAGLLFSYSQSSMVALVVAVLAATLMLGDRAARRLATAACATAVLAGIGLAVAFALADEQGLADQSRSRYRLVADTAAVALDHPVIGVGLGAQPAVTQTEQDPGLSEDRNVSHTTPLTVAAELGVLGLGFYLTLLAGTVVVVRRLLRERRGLGAALGAALLVLLVHSFLYAGFFDNPLVWGALGLTAGAASRLRADRRPASRTGVPA
ncbi:MAG: O-antigen ligase family protein [Thermoleophilaceae bacterium]|nr:O-antigen ligase family protein [Thermoleophilaceae bacterium]